MSKDELLAAIESEWEALQAAIDDLNEEQLTRIPVSGRWTIKDVLAHLAVWQSRLVTDLYKVERGMVPEHDLTEVQIDRLNDQYYREQKDRPLERILDDLYGVHTALMNRLEALSDTALTDPRRYRWLGGRPLSAFVASDSYEHYREHIPEILAWRQSLTESRDAGA